MSVLPTILLGISAFLSVAFFVYGFNAIHLTLRSRKYKAPSAEVGKKPRVVIHLPIYNELYVVERLVDSCVKVAESYGRDLVRVLIIDDSTDETRGEVDRLEELYSSRGYNIGVLRRGDRVGFKAGALQAALKESDEEFIAVFDADFVPTPDFLTRTVPYLTANPKVGFVQARWGHFNRGYNAVTKALAIGSDAHFFVEQPGRWESSYLMNFNGSAGVLRREAIAKAGGWEADTLAEDLDVSYRMQLAGYRAIYLRDLVVPAELPPTITALKRQQGRWARGSIQTLKKLGPRLFKSKDLSAKQKVEAGIHLSYYAVHPLMVVSFLIASVAALSNTDVIKLGVAYPVTGLGSGQGNSGNLLLGLLYASPWIAFFVLIIVCTVAVLFYGVEALRDQGMSTVRNIPTLIVLVAIGYGISISNSVSVFSGLFLNSTGSFARTPKYAITKRVDDWKGKKYQIHFERTTLLEGTAVLLGAAAVVWAALDGNLGIVPILMVYLVSYFVVFALTLRHTLKTGEPA